MKNVLTYTLNGQEGMGLVRIPSQDIASVLEVEQDLLKQGWTIVSVDYGGTCTYVYTEKKKDAQKKNKPVYKGNDKFCNSDINLTTTFASADDSIKAYSAEKSNPVDEWTRQAFRYQ